MRLCYIVGGLAFVAAAFVSPVQTQAQVYGANDNSRDVYYSPARIAYYRPYASVYYARPTYYAGPVNYSYDPGCVRYVPPPSCEPSPSYQQPTTPKYSQAQPSAAKPATTVTIGAYDNRFEPKTL